MPAALQHRKHSEHRALPRQARPPSVVGWHGIYVEVPEEWNLRQVSGDMTAGYLTVESPEGESHVRVKWQHHRKAPEVQKILDRYLRSIEKKVKGTGFEASTDLNLRLNEEQLKRKPLFFSWKTDNQAIGLIWYCRSCGRVTIAQIDGPLKRNLTLLSTQVLGSLDDHAVDGCHTWAAYGLAAELPADFRLEKHKLLSGHIHLEFANGRTTIHLDRWGLADVTLRRESLEAWHRRTYFKTLRSYRFQVQEAVIRGHAGLAVTGPLSDLRDRAKAAVMTVARLRPVTQVTQFVWPCEQTNRICSVLVQHARDQTDLAEEIAASFTCHSD